MTSWGNVQIVLIKILIEQYDFKYVQDDEILCLLRELDIHFHAHVRWTVAVGHLTLCL